jgi:hypothetical protein
VSSFVFSVQRILHITNLIWFLSIFQQVKILLQKYFSHPFFIYFEFWLLFVRIFSEFCSKLPFWMLKILTTLCRTQNPFREVNIYKNQFLLKNIIDSYCGDLQLEWVLAPLAYKWHHRVAQTVLTSSFNVFVSFNFIVCYRGTIWCLIHFWCLILLKSRDQKCVSSYLVVPEIKCIFHFRTGKMSVFCAFTPMLGECWQTQHTHTHTRTHSLMRRSTWFPHRSNSVNS